MVHLTLFAQGSPPDASLAALVRRLVRGSLGFTPGSSTTLILLVVSWFAMMAAVTALLQRDRNRWLQGLLDIRAHFEQLAAGLDILRINKRPLWILLVAAVVSWTGWSVQTWQDATSKEELEAMLAIHENSAARFATAHALTASISPLRSLTALADVMPLAIGACILLFTRTAAISDALRSRTRAAENLRLKRRLGMFWIALILLSTYRAAVFVVAPDTAPLADCLYINAFTIPLLALAADAILLSWLIVEYSRALNSHFDWHADDSVAFVRTIPGAVAACVLLNAGRYLLIFAALWHAQFATPNWPPSRWHGILFASALMQVQGLAWLALPSVLVVDRRRGLRNLFYSYLELVRRAGGQIVGLSIVSVVLSFVAVLPFYWIFGAMQRETWSLLGAASYGHYVSLLVGIVLLAGLTQLAHRELGMKEPEPPMAILLPPLVGQPASVPV
jgi:hypothetical protein